MFKRLWSMLTVFFVSAWVYAGGKQASPYPEFANDSILLRLHNQENTDASTEIVEAAKRMFKHVNLRGKKADWIRQTLGKPFKTVGLKERIIWVYQFVGPKKTVGCTLHFDAVGYKVTKVLNKISDDKYQEGP